MKLLTHCSKRSKNAFRKTNQNTGSVGALKNRKPSVLEVKPQCHQNSKWTFRYQDLSHSLRRASRDGGRWTVPSLTLLKRLLHRVKQLRSSTSSDLMQLSECSTPPMFQKGAFCAPLLDHSRPFWFDVESLPGLLDLSVRRYVWVLAARAFRHTLAVVFEDCACHRTVFRLPLRTLPPLWLAGRLSLGSLALTWNLGGGVLWLALRTMLPLFLALHAAGRGFGATVCQFL